MHIREVRDTSLVMKESEATNIWTKLYKPSNKLLDEMNELDNVSNKATTNRSNCVINSIRK